MAALSIIAVVVLCGSWWWLGGGDLTVEGLLCLGDLCC